MTRIAQFGPPSSSPKRVVPPRQMTRDDLRCAPDMAMFLANFELAS
jgi:hypothetical protein